MKHETGGDGLLQSNHHVEIMCILTIPLEMGAAASLNCTQAWCYVGWLSEERRTIVQNVLAHRMSRVIVKK
jgi:hypothetical protein